MKQYFLIFAVLFGLSSGMYTSRDDVIELTPSNFDKLVTKSNEVWVVEFYAPWCGHCQQLVKEYNKLATALKGIVKVGAVNADEHKSLGGQFSVRGFPTIKIFGADKNSPIDFNGQRTASAMADSALAEAKKIVNKRLGGGSGSSSGGSNSKDDVIELTDDNFDKLVLNSDEPWLVEFFAPWCGHCKNLAPQWAKAASELKGKIKMGALDATVHQSKAAEYGIRGYPTIKFFPAGKKSKSDVQEYDGGRQASDIVSWGLDKYEDIVEAPELYEVTDEKTFNKACDGVSICVVSVLPHILDCDANCRNKYLDTLKEMGEKYKKKQWGWIWSEAGFKLTLKKLWKWVDLVIQQWQLLASKK
uniref:Protein disulfide-isomerase A6 homolog n=1 Tax=Megaselia scalaris TaxID=36166 RepID=T1GI35_MEGSC